MMKLLDVNNKLMTIGLATDVVGHIKKNKKPGYYLLVLDIENMFLKISTFPGIEKGLDQATEEYNKIEKEKQNKKIDAVLVSAQSYESLVSAYPNYFADIKDFSKLLNNLITKYQKAFNFSAQNVSVNGKKQIT